MPSESIDNAADSRIPQILTGTIIPSFLATIFVLARIYSRGVLTRSWGLDDTLVAISWLCGMALTVINCTFISYGYGRHKSFQTPQQAATAAQLSYASRIIYQFVLGSTKLSICALYLHVFVDRRSKLLVYFLSGFIVLFSVPLTIYIMASCVPTDSGLQSPTCHSNHAPDFFMSAACNILADFLLLIFVVPRILPLKMAVRQKVALLAVVSLSSLVIVAAVVRLLQVMQFNASSDRTWNMSNITTWSAVEIDTGLFCASAPAIRPLLRRLRFNFVSSSKNRASEERGQLSYIDSRRFGIGEASNLNCTNGHIELDSRSNRRQGKSASTNPTTIKIWGGDDSMKERSIEDGESAQEIFDSRFTNTGILKVVNITVDEQRGYYEEYKQDLEGGTVIFEPI